jgi:hypothetical protein
MAATNRNRRGLFRNLPVLPPSVPIQELSIIPHAQANSPLFNGRIPPETRNQIFYYALTEYTITYPSALYPRATDFYRPGYVGPKAITIALLQTCRRIYLETYHLPPIMKEHIFWHDPHTGPHRGVYSEESRYFARFQSWQNASDQRNPSIRPDVLA